MNSIFYFGVMLLVFLEILFSNATAASELNLTNWRQNRREKRFILFEHAGISKLVAGVTIPVELSDKKFWRQLVMTMNFQYQFPVPPRVYYWWDLWGDRALPSSAVFDNSLMSDTVDYAQLLLYQMVEELMNQRHINGSACLQLAICENSQIHRHRGLFAEILHRILIPHKSMDAHYVDAYNMGQHGVECRTTFLKEKVCPLDSYVHILDK